MVFYSPHEDSFLLQSAVRKYARGRVLDLGTGSGIQAATAAGKKSVKSVLAVDISKSAIDYCRKNIRNKKIKFAVSNLFSKIHGRFDAIVFNPPYLPAAGYNDKTITGGRKGWETIARFLQDTQQHLAGNGIILLLFSTLTNKNVIDTLVAKNLFMAEVVARQKLAFEELFVYKLQPFKALQKLKKAEVKDAKYFMAGKRGIVLTGKYRGKTVAVKFKLPSSAAKGRIANEARWLRLLNKKGIGPRLYKAANDYIIYEFVKGKFLKDWLPKAGKKEAIGVLKQLLNQAFIMDVVGVEKQEMQRPLKNAIVRGKKLVLIDFERCRRTKKPSNVTQVVQFLMNWRKVFAEKGIKIDDEKMIELARNYKENPSKQQLQKIISEFE